MTSFYMSFAFPLASITDKPGKFLLCWILQYRRERRASINQVKTHPWFTSQQAELDELYKTIVMLPTVK